MSDYKEIFYHEDDYCQIELLPFENSLLVNQTNSKINSQFDNISENGFSQLYSRDEIKFSLSFLNISTTEFEKKIKDNALSYFDKIYTGYSTEKKFKANTHAFGFENYLIFYEFNPSDKIITKAWINYLSISQTLNVTPLKLMDALFNLAFFDLILVDWNELATINLKNKLDIETYIKNVL